MISSKEKFSKVVRFAPTEADQALLNVIEQTLAAKSYRSFSDLCKQALRQFLQPPETTQLTLLFTALQQQVTDLQIQMATLKQEVEVRDGCPIGAIEQRLAHLSDRLDQLEPKTDTTEPLDASLSASSPSPDTAADPLLSRLAPLLEEF
jgi:hypothetical protein